ncbi:MAG: BACON domain-containing protein [Prevotellaceae bacterium]|nr:BACON domain-containing protein [Prevotellaceae bacterium]
MKTKHYFIAMLTLATFVVFTACKKDKETPINPEPPDSQLVVTPAELTFDEAGGKGQITVFSPSKWSAKTSDESVAKLGSVTSGNGGDTVVITVTVSINSEATARTAEITISAGTEKKTVAIKQSGSALQNETTHDITLGNSKSAYMNAALYSDQMVTDGETDSEWGEFVYPCYATGNPPQLVYKVDIETEGYLTVTTKDDALKILITRSLSDASECIWVTEVKPQPGVNTATASIPLKPQKSGEPYWVVLYPEQVEDEATGETNYDGEFDPLSYDYTVIMYFDAKPIVVPDDPDGITLGGTVWAKYNSSFKDGKVVFAATSDAGDDLWQYDQFEPASAGNWYGPDDYADRTNASLKNPEYVACPTGWRLPTNAEVVALIEENFTTVLPNEKGTTYGGLFFGPNSDDATISDPKGCVFLPFVGYIDGNNAAGYPEMPERSGLDSPYQSHYTLSDIQLADGPYFMVIASEEVDIKGVQKQVGVTEGWSRPWRAQAVRCVKITD